MFESSSSSFEMVGNLPMSDQNCFFQGSYNSPGHLVYVKTKTILTHMYENCVREYAHIQVHTHTHKYVICTHMPMCAHCSCQEIHLSRLLTTATVTCKDVTIQVLFLKSSKQNSMLLTLQVNNAIFIKKKKKHICNITVMISEHI